MSRDFADRPLEEEALEQVRSLALAPTTQEAPAPGDPQSGPRAMPLRGLPFYMRGARFAALAMGRRHGHHDDSIEDDSKAYVAQMDRFMGTVRELRQRQAQEE